MKFSWKSTEKCTYYIDETGKIIGSIINDYVDNTLYRSIYQNKMIGTYIDRESAMKAIENSTSNIRNIQ